MPRTTIPPLWDVAASVACQPRGRRPRALRGQAPVPATQRPRTAAPGRALLAELEDRALAFGATEVVLDTNASLEAAGSLYRRAGYVDVEPYNDNPNATNWYAKRLARA